MLVFITGATGVLGRRLVEQFCARGDQVVGVVRSAAGEKLVRLLGGEPRQADLFDAEALARAAEGAEVVIHAATAIPMKTKPAPEDWATNDRIRREGSRALAACARRIRARRYLFQSIVWVARPADQAAFDETSPVVRHPIYDSAAEGEVMAREAGCEVSVLRCGGFYGADSGHTRELARLLQEHKMPIVGDGKAVWAMLHADDAAAAFVTAAHAARTGLWHVVDDTPVTAAEFLEEFARLLGARPPRRAPVFLARLVAGDAAVEYLTTSTRTSNARFKREVGWTPKYPSYREGLGQVVRGVAE